jgi:hypothetical protein
MAADRVNPYKTETGVLVTLKRIVAFVNAVTSPPDINAVQPAVGLDADTQNMASAYRFTLFADHRSPWRPS